MENVIRVNRLCDIAELKEPWKELLWSSDEDRLFLSWEWVFTWCKYRSKDQDLFLLIVTDGDKLNAIAPFVIRKANFFRLKLFKSVNFMATDVVGSDYMNIVIRRGEEKAAVEAIAEYLKNAHISLELSHLCAESVTARMLATQLSSSSWSVIRREIEVCPYVDLIGHSWGSYLRSLGSSHRANIKRKIRKVYENYAVEFSLVGDDESLCCAFDQMVMLHYKRHGNSSVSDAFNSESVLRFHEQIAHLSLKESSLRLYVMKLDSIPVAALYGFIVDGKFYFYQSGFDPDYAKYSVGLILLSHTIEQAIAGGALEYDFLHGNEQYKYLWSNKERTLERLYIFAPTVSGSVSRYIHLIKQWFKGRAAGLFKS